jgi:hypothetical protein
MRREKRKEKREKRKERREKREEKREKRSVLFLMAKLLKQPVLFNAKLNNLCQRNYLVRHKIGRLHHLY